jgi:hypothetical protein
MTNLKEIIANEKVKGIIAIIAAIVMYFTPVRSEPQMRGATVVLWRLNSVP